IAAAVGIIIRFTKRDKQHFRFVFFQFFHGIVVGEGIKTHAAPRTTNLILQQIKQLLPFVQIILGFCKACVDGNSATFCIDDKRKNIPRAKSRHFSIIGWLLVKVFQHRDVGIIYFVVAVDAFIVGKACKDLVIAGIGKPHAIRAIHFIVVLAVAVELALLGKGTPEKGHEYLPSFEWVRMPKLLGQSIWVVYIAGIIYEQRVRPRK